MKNRVVAVGRVMRSRPLDPVLFVAIADGGHHLHRALAIHRRVDLAQHCSYMPAPNTDRCDAFIVRSLALMSAEDNRWCCDVVVFLPITLSSLTPRALRFAGLLPN